MVNLVTNGFDEMRFEIVKEYLRYSFPSITTFVNTSHTGVAQVAIGEKQYIGFGEGVIHDKMEALHSKLLQLLSFKPILRRQKCFTNMCGNFLKHIRSDLLYDMYCGAGTISLFMAPHVKHVVGIELVPQAVKNAYANADANDIDNCTFVQGDIKNLFDSEFITRHGKPDVFIVDPPRAGMHEKVVKQIADLKPARFVYVKL